VTAAGDLSPCSAPDAWNLQAARKMVLLLAAIENCALLAAENVTPGSSPAVGGGQEGRTL
jgi:hypothetical protein